MSSYLQGNFTITDLETWIKEMYSSPQGRMAYYNLLRRKKTLLFFRSRGNLRGISPLAGGEQELAEARKYARSYIEQIRAERPQEMFQSFIEDLPQYSKKVGISLHPQVYINFIKEPIAKWRR